jgi:ElaB/YqjD/DUF883 family membrane-anchored ribosome-binding protein
MDQRSDQLKADIEDTRAEMGQTLNEIQERLSPEHLMDQVKETVREATIGKVERVMEKVNEKISNVTEPAMEVMGLAGEKLKETGSSVGNVVYANPIPFALMGLGLGMFIVSRVRNADGRTRRSYGHELDSEMGYGMAKPRSAGMRREATNTGDSLLHTTAEKVSHLGHQAQEGAMWAGRGFQRLVTENPLAVGAAAVAVGAAVGLALPSTRLEKEYMGEASEKIVDKAQQVARDAMDKVKSATQPAQPESPSAQAGNQPPQPPSKPAQPGQSQPNRTA